MERQKLSPGYSTPTKVGPLPLGDVLQLLKRGTARVQVAIAYEHYVLVDVIVPCSR